MCDRLGCNEDPYPSSVQDINYAVRWAKLNARAQANRAAYNLPCSSSCGRGMRATRRSLCRQVLAGRMRQWAAS